MRRKNIIPSKKWLLFLILLTIVTLLLLPNGNKKNKSYAMIENTNSPILLGLLDQQHFSDEWKFKDIYTFQAENKSIGIPEIANEYGSRTFVGNYQQYDIQVDQIIYYYSIEEIPDEYINKIIDNQYPEEQYTIHEALQNAYINDTDSQIYFFSVTNSQSVEKSFFACDIFFRRQNELEFINIKLNEPVSDDIFSEILFSIKFLNNDN